MTATMDQEKNIESIRKYEEHMEQTNEKAEKKKKNRPNLFVALICVDGCVTTINTDKSDRG